MLLYSVTLFNNLFFDSDAEGKIDPYKTIYALALVRYYL